MALLEYYPKQNKIFLSEIIDKIKSDKEISADSKIVNRLKEKGTKVKLLGVNAPLVLPKCVRCKLRCPGYELCNEEEVVWMREFHESIQKKKKTFKMFAPYSERCSEYFISNELEEPFHTQPAMGANLAPLWARSHFLSRRLRLPSIEVFPKLSLWRIGQSLSIQKAHLRFHKHTFEGDESRLAILKALVDREIAFLYEQDVRLMVQNPQAFDSFLAALTAILKFKNQCESKPDGFPQEEGWIEIPKKDIIW